MLMALSPVEVKFILTLADLEENTVAHTLDSSKLPLEDFWLALSTEHRTDILKLRNKFGMSVALHRLYAISVSAEEKLDLEILKELVMSLEMEDAEIQVINRLFFGLGRDHQTRNALQLIQT